MCWITLSPKNPQHHRHPHVHHPHFHHHHHHHHDGRGPHSSTTEHLVRRDRISWDDPLPTTMHPRHHHHNKIEMIAPIPSDNSHHYHYRHGLHLHHRHQHHIHPLHLHPLPRKLHGPGKKRSPAPPPPSRCSPIPSRSTSPSHSHEPIYRIQPFPASAPQPYRTVIAAPGLRMDEIRETTRIALRESRPERGRLRRVAGYEVLGKEVPWNWDCVSSVASSDVKRKRRGRVFPPFGGPSSWM